MQGTGMQLSVHHSKAVSTATSEPAANVDHPAARLLGATHHRFGGSRKTASNLQQMLALLPAVQVPMFNKLLHGNM